MADIGVIINPNAKKIKNMKGDPVLLYNEINDNIDARVTNGPSDIRKAAEDFKKNKTEYLAVSGGDGTIHYVLSEFIKVYKSKKMPRVLILRDGTMNNIARSIKLKGKGVQLMGRLVLALNNNSEIQIARRDTIKINAALSITEYLSVSANFNYVTYEMD